MSKQKKYIENEVKFKVRDPAALRRSILRLKPQCYGRSLEQDYSFDTPEKAFLRDDRLLRLRKTRARVLVTYKGPSLPAQYKKRLEINLIVDDFSKAWKLFESLGYTGRVLKEKQREEFSCNGAHLCLDTLPFLGYYLEIEGTDRSINTLVKRLGLDPKSAITDTYVDLFDDFCKREKRLLGLKNVEFTFKSEKLLSEMRSRVG